MIKHILKIIWNQRRSNGWLFAELLVVVAILWAMMDSLLVDQYTYHSPLGFDIRNTYRIQLGILQPGMPDYVGEQEQTTRLGEDMLRLVDNLRQAPEVDEIGLAGAGSPYSQSRMSTLLAPADADSTVQARNYTYCTVTPEYFDVLRITDKAGASLRSTIGTRTGIAISEDLEKRFIEDGAMGDYFHLDGDNGERLPLIGISSSRRSTEYEKSAPYFYEVISTSQMVDIAERWQVSIDVLIRMNSGFPPEKMEAFLQGMGDRVVMNNVFISGVESLSGMRADRLKDREDNMKKKTALVGFMLINVFFGISGTFWLRTQARRGELGLRIALGSSRNQLSRLMNLEGIVLLGITIPFILIFILNMLYFDMLDTVRLPYTWWRFVVTFGGAYLLMGCMICLGIWFPICKTRQMEPAEALHYE